MVTGNRRKVFEKLCHKWTGYYTGVIIKNPAFDPYRYRGQTYRGMEITPADYAQYQVGITLTNKSFRSTSKSRKIAKTFACPKEPRAGRLPVIMIFTTTDPRLIVLGTLFMVEEVNEKQIPCEIHLAQMKWDNEFECSTHVSSSL